METRRFKCTATVSEIIIIALLVLCADPTNPSSSEDSPACADDGDLGGNREPGGEEGEWGESDRESFSGRGNNLIKSGGEAGASAPTC